MSPIGHALRAPSPPPFWCVLLKEDKLEGRLWTVWKRTSLWFHLPSLFYCTYQVYCHKRLPRFSRLRSFHERPDSAYLYLVRQCPYLHTLVGPR
jgi:hypothetical protein